MIQYQVADLVARIHVASCKFIYTVKVSNNINNLKILTLLNHEGFIEGFRVYYDFVLVFLKYNFMNRLLLFRTVSLISTPGRRQYWNLIKLNKKYSYRNFSGIFLIHSSKGLITSSDALLKLHTSGEIIFKIEV